MVSSGCETVHWQLSPTMATVTVSAMRIHSYEFYGRERLAVYIALISLLIVWILGIVLEAFTTDLPWIDIHRWVNIPSFWATYTGVYVAFDRFIWRWKPTQFIPFAKVPDLNGKWSGVVQSSYGGTGTKVPVSVEIVQRWSRMSIRLETEHSRSYSTAASFRGSDLPYPELSYLYINEPRAAAPSTMQTHNGTAFLEYRESRLLGTYYSGRGRQQFGELRLSRDVVTE